MKRTILSIAIVAASCGIAMGGSCATGQAVLSNNPSSGGTDLSCPGMGTCYETDRNDPRFLQSGDVILIHMGGTLIRAVVKSADVSSTPAPPPADGNPDENYFDTEGKIILSNI